jgi:hypothetical protein
MPFFFRPSRITSSVSRKIFSMMVERRGTRNSGFTAASRSMSRCTILAN